PSSPFVRRNIHILCSLSFPLPASSPIAHAHAHFSQNHSVHTHTHTNFILNGQLHLPRLRPHGRQQCRHHPHASQPPRRRRCAHLRCVRLPGGPASPARLRGPRGGQRQLVLRRSIESLPGPAPAQRLNLSRA
ncbi:hypothetical protein B0H11DRAFT_2283837, partial [Mycena galericulata]